MKMLTKWLCRQANYMGCGFSSWSPRLANCSIITPLDALTQSFEKVTYAHGCDVESNDTSGFAAAVAAAKAADAVVFVGGNRNCEGGQGVGGAHCESEGHDRPGDQRIWLQSSQLRPIEASF